MFSASFSIDENYFTPEEDENETDPPQNQPKSNQEEQDQAQALNQAQYHGKNSNPLNNRLYEIFRR